MTETTFHYIGEALRYRYSSRHALAVYHVILDGDQWQTWFTNEAGERIPEFDRSGLMTVGFSQTVAQEIAEGWLVPDGQQFRLGERNPEWPV